MSQSATVVLRPRPIGASAPEHLPAKPPALTRISSVPANLPSRLPDLSRPPLIRSKSLSHLDSLKAKDLEIHIDPASNTSFALIKWGGKTYRVTVLQKGKVGESANYETVARCVQNLLAKIQDKSQGFEPESVKQVRMKFKKGKVKDDGYHLENIEYTTKTNTDGTYKEKPEIITAEATNFKRAVEVSVTNFAKSASWVDSTSSKSSDPQSDLINVRGDGNCIVHALINQAEQMGLPHVPKETAQIRASVGKFIIEKADTIKQHDITIGIIDSLREALKAEKDGNIILSDVTISLTESSQKTIKRNDILKILKKKETLSEEEKLTVIQYYAGHIQQDRKWLDGPFFFFFAKRYNLQIAVLRNREELLSIKMIYPYGQVQKDGCLFIYDNEQGHYSSLQRTSPQLDPMIESHNASFLAKLFDELEKIRKPKTDSSASQVDLEPVKECIDDVFKWDPIAFRVICDIYSNKAPKKEGLTLEIIYNALLENPKILLDPEYSLEEILKRKGIMEEQIKRRQASLASSSRDSDKEQHSPKSLSKDKESESSEATD